jgi:hypothetical protein
MIQRRYSLIVEVYKVAASLADSDSIEALREIEQQELRRGRREPMKIVDNFLEKNTESK